MKMAGAGWGMCYCSIERERMGTGGAGCGSIEREHKDYGDGEGWGGAGHVLVFDGGVYEQHKKVVTHDSDETRAQTIVYSRRLGGRIFE